MFAENAEPSVELLFFRHRCNSVVFDLEILYSSVRLSKFLFAIFPSTFDDSINDLVFLDVHGMHL